MPAFPLSYFLYTSYPPTPFSEPELADLCVRAGRYNRAQGVTGLLMYTSVPRLHLAQFCGLIEGPPEAVASVQQRIEADRRHARVSQLDCGREPARLFPDWSLAYVPETALPEVEGLVDLTSLSIARVSPKRKPLVLMNVFLQMLRRDLP